MLPSMPGGTREQNSRPEIVHKADPGGAPHDSVSVHIHSSNRSGNVCCLTGRMAVAMPLS